MTRVELRPATAMDIAFVMATERTPGHERFVGQWSADRHRETMDNPANRYLIGLDAAGLPSGFAMLRDLDHPHGNVLLQRIAVAVPGRGFGRALLRAVTDWVFTQTQAHRMWFHMAADNDRARHVYTTSGFTIEGRLRQSHVMADGNRRDAMVLSMLRPEWSSLPGSATT